MTTATLNPQTLEEAQKFLRDRLSEGTECPCCEQFAKVYRRKITAATAQALILMYREARRGWVYMPDLLQRKQADETKARYWGLIEESHETRGDGSSRVGVWRLTQHGVDFVLGNVEIPKYALIYDGECQGLDESESVTIHDALGTRFNYADLMAGV